MFPAWIYRAFAALLGIVYVGRVTASLDFASAATLTTQTLTMALPGAKVGDTVLLFPAAINAGFYFCALVSAADTIRVTAFNGTAGTLDPAAASYTAIVWRAS